jgi:hypothetical protein
MCNADSISAVKVTHLPLHCTFDILFISKDQENVDMIFGMNDVKYITRVYIL